VPEYQQRSILRRVAPEQQDDKAEYPARQHVGDLERHPASQPSLRPGVGNSAGQPRNRVFERHRISELAGKYQALYPAAAKCLLTDREGLTAYLRFPAGHHHRIRHSNFIERTFGETSRRVKVIGRLPGETSCPTLVWAVLDRASAGWRGLTMTSDGLRLLQDLRRSLLDPPAQLRPRTVTAAQPDDHPETVRATA